VFSALPQIHRRESKLLTGVVLFSFGFFSSSTLASVTWLGTQKKVITMINNSSKSTRESNDHGQKHKRRQQPWLGWRKQWSWSTSQKKVTQDFHVVG
jgi:hypothetical protein